MAKRIDFTKIQREEIRQQFCKRKKLRDVGAANRITVLNMRRLGESNKQIAIATGFSVQYIRPILKLNFSK